MRLVGFAGDEHVGGCEILPGKVSDDPDAGRVFGISACKNIADVEPLSIHLAQ